MSVIITRKKTDVFKDSSRFKKIKRISKRLQEVASKDGNQCPFFYLSFRRQVKNMIYTKRNEGPRKPKRNSTGSTDSVVTRFSKLQAPNPRPQRRSAGSVCTSDCPSATVGVTKIVSAPISDTGSNIDSPIFARKTVIWNTYITNTTYLLPTSLNIT